MTEREKEIRERLDALLDKKEFTKDDYVEAERLISELEKDLGEKLFNRERGAVSLTDKGQLFKGYADQILHWYRAADAAFRGPSVFETESDIPKPLELPLGEGRNARIWASQGDIHISLK